MDVCTACGLLVGDWPRHLAWHAALDSLWTWADRVSGHECDTAREHWEPTS